MTSKKEDRKELGEQKMYVKNTVAILDSDKLVAPKLVYDNETFEILHCNSAAAKFFGYSKNELVKLKLTDICINNMSAQVDTGLIELPIEKLNRIIQDKTNALYSCETRDFPLDFETSVLTFHNIVSLNVYSVLQLLN